MRPSSASAGQRFLSAFAIALTLASGLVLTAAMPASAVVDGVTYAGSRAVHAVALTFDDGFDIVPCRTILATLISEHVAATFFPVGSAVADNPTFWRQVDEAGFPIADHSQTHPDMTKLTPAQQLWQLRTSRDTIERILGHRMTRIFRPPFGAVNDQVVESAHETGFPTVVYWDTSDGDSSPNGTDAQYIANATRGRNGSIILMHCGPAVTPRILPAVIDFYRSRGYAFLTVPQLLGLSPWLPESVPTARVMPSRPPVATPTPAATPTATPSPTPTPSASPPSATPAAPANAIPPSSAAGPPLSAALLADPQLRLKLLGLAAASLLLVLALIALAVRLHVSRHAGVIAATSPPSRR